MGNEDTLSEVLAEFARTLLTDFSIQRILDRLVERIVDILPITAAGVTLIPDGGSPRHIAASDPLALAFERLQSDLGEGPCLAAYESGEAVAIADLAVDDRFPRFRPAAAAAGLVGVFTFPLRHPEGRLGALDLYRDAPGGLGPRDMNVAQTLADVAAAYLLNAWAHETERATVERFRERTLHDSLTGLPNRLLLQDRLAHAALRARRSHGAAGVLFVDIDQFKAVNDTYGHHAGDELLVAIARRLERIIRSGDTLARVSGDEFVFLCEDLESRADVEALRRRVETAFTQPFVLAAHTVTVSASVGLAYADPGEDLSDELVSRADAAMYDAKRRRGVPEPIIDLREGAVRTRR
ncbi:MAG TPA: sensor domain-containing diguanylate cyclase [Acidimicrobiia bacterium]|nr:sensor domain-containing diguanylate cyclase [Acidimicrobiia bacterium]